MELFVWPGDFGIPSMDLQSAQMLAYCKFSGAPVKTTEINNTWNVLSSVPRFTHGSNIEIKSFDDLVAHLKRQNYNCDQNLTKSNLTDIQAYMSTIAQKLEPALIYLFWAQLDNYNNLTRPWFAKRIPFPASWVLPGYYQDANLESLRRLVGPQYFTKTQHLLDEADKCLNLLSQKLSDQKYFFGDSPTTFDAYVYGFLSLCTIPFPNFNPLRNTINNLTNLQSYLSRIRRSYFPDIQDPTDKKPDEVDPDYPNAALDITLSCLFAASVMFTYAYLHTRHFRKR